MKTIHSLKDYISEISKIVQDISDNESIAVFRGEEKDYGMTACVPNIFRENYLNNNRRFEKNLFDEMKANGLTVGSNYLEYAVCAQHDGFPSRLLDVTYSSLVALYFACTPYFHKPITLNDDKDGVVYIFSIEQIFCPTGENILNSYQATIEADENSFINCPLFAKNHKLIDHIKTNKRIIAQQGAFILFQGDDYEPLPKRICQKILIDKTAKAVLRRQLKLLFGIDTGSMYPQADNYVEDMIRRSRYVESAPFGLKSETDMILFNLQRDFDYYIDNILLNKASAFSVVFELEKTLKDYYICINNLIQRLPMNEDAAETPELQKQQIVINDFVSQYNDILESELDYLQGILADTEIIIDRKSFIIIQY